MIMCIYSRMEFSSSLLPILPLLCLGRIRGNLNCLRRGSAGGGGGGGGLGSIQILVESFCFPLSSLFLEQRKGRASEIHTLKKGERACTGVRSSRLLTAALYATTFHGLCHQQSVSLLITYGPHSFGIYLLELGKSVVFYYLSGCYSGIPSTPSSPPILVSDGYIPMADSCSSFRSQVKCQFQGRVFPGLVCSTFQLKLRPFSLFSCSSLFFFLLNQYSHCVMWELRLTDKLCLVTKTLLRWLKHTRRYSLM